MNNNIYNLTNPQKSIWFTEEVYNGIPVENIAGSVIINENVNFELLCKAINLFAKNNASFNLKFIKSPEGVVQVLQNFEEFPIEIINVESNKDVKKLEKKLSNTSFDVLNSKLYSAKLFKFPDNHGGFVISIHHLIADAWTSGLIIDGIINIYSELLENPNKNDFSFPSYIDYIETENEYLKSNKFLKDKEYWNSIYANVPELASIPSSLTSNDVSKFNPLAKRKVFTLPTETFELINNFSKKCKASPFNFFMGIIALYLGRVSNLNEFVIGTPILNRSNFKDKHTTGMFISNVPFKVTINNELKFSEFISKISSDFFDIFRHQKYPYQYLLEDLRKQNSSIPNLYDIGFSYQNMRTDSPNSKINFVSSWSTPDYIVDSLDIHIFDLDNTGTLNIAYDYQTAKYSLDDICSIHARILNIINQILDNEEINLKDIEIVTPYEKEKLLYDFNNTYMDYPKDKTISELFEEQVRKTPDNIAVVFENQKLTYKELNEKANSLATYLKSLKIPHGSMIPTILNRSIDLIVSILAIVKSGNTYLPIIPDYPIDRIKYIIQNSNSKYILTNTKSIPTLNTNYTIINIDEINYSTFNNLNLKNENTPSDILYVIYTSGSTGNPKGVAITHKNLNNFIHSFNNSFKNISSEDRILASTSICFDVSIFEIFISLLNGSTLCLYTENSITNIFNYCDCIINNNITMLYIPPNLLDDVYKILFEKKYNKINKILLGVEPIHYNIVKQYYNLNSNCTIINAYGPTETTICATSYSLSTENINNYNIIPIGKPLSNLKLFVLNSNLMLIPIGSIGELYITGDNLSKGYIFNTNLNKESFIKLSYCNDIAYKTGDLVKWNNDGTISFVGRNDSQVKINGHRIELGEIEKVIYLYPDIEKCIVIYSKNKLIAYFTSNTTISIDKLKIFLQNKLPLYFIPNYIVQVDQFKLTSNGKIDKKALNNIKMSSSSNYEKASNKLQLELVNAFKSVLNLDSIGINDNFFDLGGDSLSSIKLQVFLYNNGFNVSAQDIFTYPTIKMLSDFIEKRSTYHITNKEKSIDLSSNSFFELSSAQKRIYYNSNIAGTESTLYNTPGGIILNSPLDSIKLEKCIKELVQRHPSFRTHFLTRDNKLIQKIDNDVSFNLEVKNNVPTTTLHEEFKSFVKPFDLSNAPLIRAKYINLSNGKSAFFVDMHHIISDGTSLSIFIDELCKLYNGEALDNLNVTYTDYINFEQKKFASGEFIEAKKYWINQFSDEIPSLNMPTTYSRPAIKSFDGKKFNFNFDIQTTKKIENLCNDLHITPYMFLLSAYYILLYKYTDQNDIIVGSPVVGRSSSDFFNVIGMFVNTLPIRAKIVPKNTSKDFLTHIKEICLANYKYQDYPFDELVNNLNIQRDTSRNPLFDTMFIYQNNGNSSVNFADIKSEYYIPDTNISKFDLSLEIIPNNDGLNLSFEYCTKLFDKFFIENLSVHYKNIINAILNNIDIKIADIDMLSEKEKNKILYEFNNTNMEYPKDKTISQLFEEQVKKTPNNIAIVFENKKLTYKELNEKANSLAYYLRNNGISRNDIVGIMVNRSLEMIVSILAVLKSGGCYIPIDPTYPQDRIEYMLQNSNSKYLLTFESLKDTIDFDNKIFVELSSSIYAENKINLENINSSEDLAYVIYTSGSTGMPKGVMLKHSSITNLTTYLNNSILFFNEENISKTIASVTTISFDIFIFETLICLQKGLKIIIANEEEQHIPEKLFNLIKKHNVEIIQMTPSRMQLFIDNINVDTLSPLKYVILAGEALPDLLLSKLLDLKINKVYNGYGPSETTIFSTFTDVTSFKHVNIGKPLANTQTYILDKNKNICPINIPGELYISGDGVGLGYLNNEALTKLSYIENKFLPNSIMYKTGDLCSLNKNLELQYLGRIDNQIKIRGLRIELDEIENKILSYPNIKKACVIKQTIDNRDFLSAYFVQEKRINVSKLRDYLASFLPKYMVPSYFTTLEDFPYTPNGKINKKALPLPKEILNNNDKKEYILAKTDIEKELVSIWEDILNISPIGITDNFFELGGDSILAMNLNIELRKKYENITYSDIFKYPTITKLIKKINSKNENFDFKYMEKNYNKYKPLFSNTKVPSIFQLKYSNPGNILLTGATGFLGMHILSEFIKKEKGNIYCLVREEPGLTAQAKLLQKLHYYFGNKYDKLLGKRIFAITGDISMPGFGLNQEELLNISNNISVVINTAARVTHYGNYSDFYNSNVKSVIHTIEFCKSFNKKLYHISTLSVSGNAFDAEFVKQTSDEIKYFNENSLYIGQSLENVYLKTKFEAECLILDAILDGLDAYILRVGNLMPRLKDGLFQENFSDNAFINRIIAFIKIGIVPTSLLENYLEFTPIDTISTAILKLLTHPNTNTRIYHLFNHNHVYINTCINYFKTLNSNLKIVDEQEFEKHINRILHNQKEKKNLNLLINDMDKDLHLSYKSNIIVKSDYTIKYLSKLGFNWPKINDKYMIKFINLLRKVL